MAFQGLNLRKLAGSINMPSVISVLNVGYSMPLTGSNGTKHVTGSKLAEMLDEVETNEAVRKAINAFVATQAFDRGLTSSQKATACAWVNLSADEKATIAKMKGVTVTDYDKLAESFLKVEGLTVESAKNAYASYAVGKQGRRAGVVDTTPLDLEGF